MYSYKTHVKIDYFLCVRYRYCERDAITPYSYLTLRWDSMTNMTKICVAFVFETKHGLVWPGGRKMRTTHWQSSLCLL